MFFSRWTAVCALVALGLTALPALAVSFDAPFTGTVNIEIVSVTGSNGDLGGDPLVISESGNGSSVGSITIMPGDPSRSITNGHTILEFDLEGGSYGSWPNLAFDLPMLDPSTPFQLPLPGSGPLNTPIASADPIPPVGSKFAMSPPGSYALGDGKYINIVWLELQGLSSRTPIPGGEQLVYNSVVAFSLAGFRPYWVTLGFSGQTVINVTPEPASVLMLLGAGPLLLRRRIGSPA